MHGLKPRESSLLAVLLDKRDRWGETRLTMDELGDLTEMSRTTLWRALTTLMNLGMVETTRTKRNFGKLYKNRYRVLVSEQSESETSTASPSNLISQDSYIAISTHINTSYLYSLAAAGREGESETSMVNKWSDDDSEQMGFGLFGTQQEAKPVSKRDPKTRHQRPEAEWTAADVASEFARNTYEKVRGVPNILNTKSLTLALAKNRKEHGVTATTELKLMRRFFLDEGMVSVMKKFPKRTMGLFLNYITRNITEVSQTATYEQAFAMEDSLEYIYASDGRKFPQSISGRADLDRYEKKLEQKNG